MFNSLRKCIFLPAWYVCVVMVIAACDGSAPPGDRGVGGYTDIGPANTSTGEPEELPAYKLPDVFLMTNRQPAEIKFYYDDTADPLPVRFEPKIDKPKNAVISLEYTENLRSVIVHARTPGDYNVRVTVTNGQKSLQDSFTIRVVDSDFVVPEVSIRPFFRPVQDWDLSAYHSPLMHATAEELYVAYLWTVNGQPYTESHRDILFNHPFKRGDVITVQLLVTDQIEVWESPVSAPVTIANSLPTLDAAFSPAAIHGGQALSVAVSNIHDPEDDAVSIRYQWLLNGEVLAGQTNETLPAGVAVFKDELSVQVIANDGYDEAVETITLTVGDTPSALNHDGSIVEFRYGEPNSYAVEFVDPDGTPVQTLLHAAPEGVSYENGILQWTPNPTMLFSSENFTVTLVSSDGQTGEVRMTVINPDQQPLIARSAFATPQLENNVYVLDFDGDGVAEFLSTDTDDRIFTGEVRGNTLLQDWLYPYSGKSEGAIRFIEPTGQGALFVTREHAVQLIDSVSSAPRTVFKSHTEILTAAWDDVDGDGVSEAILLLANDRLQIVDSTDWNVRHNIALQKHNRPAPSVITGNVDNDAALEIITGSGDVIDGASGTVQWRSTFRFGDGLATGDVDGDGLAEIVAADRYSYLAVYDARARNVRNYSHDETDICSVLVANVDGDLQQEIITGGCQAETIAIRELSGSSILVKHQYPQGVSVPRPRNLALGDLNSDGQPELIWTTGQDTTFNRGFVVATLPDADASGDHVIAQNEEPAELGELSLLGITTGPGNTAAVFSSVSSTGLETGQRLIRLENSGIEAVSSPAGANTVRQSGFLADSNGDGVDEAFLSSRNPYHINNYSIDSFAAQNYFPTGLNQRSIAPGRLSDGSFVMLMASDDIFNNVARVYDLTSGNLLYISSRFPDQVEFMFTYQYESSTHFIFATPNIIRRFEIVDGKMVNTTGTDATCDHIVPLKYNNSASVLCVENHHDETDLTVYDVNLQEVTRHRLDSAITAVSTMPATGYDKLLLGLQACDFAYSACANDSRLGIFDTFAKTLTWQSHSLIGEITGVHVGYDQHTGKQVFAVGSRNAMYLSQ